MTTLLARHVASSASASCRLNRLAPPTVQGQKSKLSDSQQHCGWSWLTLLRRQPRGTIKARQSSVAVGHISAGGQAVGLFWCSGTSGSRAMSLLAYRKVLMLQCVVTASDGTEERLCPRRGAASTHEALLEFLPALVVSKSCVADCLSSCMTDECGVVLLLKYLLLAADTLAIFRHAGGVDVLLRMTLEPNHLQLLLAKKK